MANKLIVGSPQAMAKEPSLEPPEPIESPPDLDEKILATIADWSRTAFEQAVQDEIDKEEENPMNDI